MGRPSRHLAPSCLPPACLSLCVCVCGQMRTSRVYFPSCACCVVLVGPVHRLVVSVGVHMCRVASPSHQTVRPERARGRQVHTKTPTQWRRGGEECARPQGCAARFSYSSPTDSPARRMCDACWLKRGAPGAGGGRVRNAKLCEVLTLLALTCARSPTPYGDEEPTPTLAHTDRREDAATLAPFSKAPHARCTCTPPSCLSSL